MLANLHIEELIIRCSFMPTQVLTQEEFQWNTLLKKAKKGKTKVRMG